MKMINSILAKNGSGRATVLALLLTLMGGTVSRASDQIPAPPQKKPIALVGGTIHTITKGDIANGTIVFDKGKITAIGTNVTVPADAIRIDISGKHVYPSLIEGNSSLGLVEVRAVRATRDYAEVGSINPNVRPEVAINPDSEHFPVTRANGVGLAVTRPTGGVIAGQMAFIMLDGWTWEDMTLKAPVGMWINWPRMTVISAWWMRQTPEQQRKSMKKNLKRLEKAFEEAKAYMVAKEAAGAKGVPFHKFDARWEAMIPVLKGELPVFVGADEIKQIRAAVDFADRWKLKMVLVGGADAPLAADLLKRKNIPVVVTPVLRLPSRRDADFDAPFTLPKKLYDAGIPFCIAGGSRMGNERNLPYHAAKAAAYGLPREEALKAITLYAAQIFGVADRVGSLEVGKDASLFVADGDPLEIPTQVEMLFLQGRKVDLNNKHKTLYLKYKEKYRQKKAESAGE